jgi:hypothetical protein
MTRAISVAVLRHPIKVIIIANKTTRDPPMLTPAALIPVAIPRRRENQFCTAVVTGRNPAKLPPSASKANTRKKCIRDSIRLKRKNPVPKRSAPSSIILRGPKRSMRYPSIGPSRALSSRVREKAVDNSPRLTLRVVVIGKKKAANP